MPDEVLETALDYGSDPQTAEYLMQGNEVAEATNASTPGFGAVVALGALGSAALLAYRNSGSSENESEEDLEELGEELE